MKSFVKESIVVLKASHVSLLVCFIRIVCIKPFLGNLVLDWLIRVALPLRFVLNRFPIGVVVKDEVHAREGVSDFLS